MEEKKLFIVAVRSEGKSEVFQFQTEKNRLDFISALQEQHPDAQFSTSEIDIE